MRTTIYLILCVLLLAGCSSLETCKGSYFEFKSGDCCLDANANQICDADEGVTPQDVKEEAEQQRAIDKLQEKLENKSGTINVYDTVRESFDKQCYVWKENEVTSEGNDYWWENTLNARCNIIQDCTDYYMGLNEFSAESTRNELDNLIAEGKLRCEAEPPADWR